MPVAIYTHKGRRSVRRHSSISFVGRSGLCECAQHRSRVTIEKPRNGKAKAGKRDAIGIRLHDEVLAILQPDALPASSPTCRITWQGGLKASRPARNKPGLERRFEVSRGVEVLL